MKKIILIMFLLFSLGEAREYLYLMPDEGKKAENKMVELYKNAHKSIKIVIYSFTNKRFLKAIKQAARRGVKVTVIANQEESRRRKSYSILPQLAKLRNVTVKLLHGKRNRYGYGLMHIKLSIIDDRIVEFGSANYSYGAFHNNYEIVYINDNITFTKKFFRIFDKLNRRAREY